MRLRDVCPCRLGNFPDVILTSGMSIVCTEGHRIIVSFNYIPETLRKKDCTDCSSPCRICELERNERNAKR